MVHRRKRHRSSASHSELKNHSVLSHVARRSRYNVHRLRLLDGVPEDPLLGVYRLYIPYHCLAHLVPDGLPGLLVKGAPREERVKNQHGHANAYQRRFWRFDLPYKHGRCPRKGLLPQLFVLATIE